MLTHTVVLVALLAPQQGATSVTPPAPPSATPTVAPPQGAAVAETGAQPERLPAAASSQEEAFASALPENTLVAAQLGALGEQRRALRETALATIVRALPLPAEATEAFAALGEQAREITGLDDATLLGAFEHGVTLALTHLEADGTPGIVLGANLPGDPDVYRMALERAARHFESVEDEHLGTTIWTLRTASDDGFELAACIRDNMLIAATGLQQLKATLDRQANDAAPSLTGHPAYREFRQNAMSAGNRLFSCFIQTRTVVGELLTRMGGSQLEQARRLVKALQLQHVHSLGYTVRIEEGRFQDHLRVFFPEPRTGLLGALAGPGTALSANSARLVPPGVSSFTISHLDLPRIFAESTGLVESIDPRAAGMIRSGLQILTKQTGVDLEQDILRSLAQQMVTLQWPSEDGSLHFATMLATKDSWRLEKALLRLLGSFDMRPKPRTWRGHSVYRIEAPPGSDTKLPENLSYAIGENYIVFATSEDSMRSTLAQLAEPTENRQALRFLSRLPLGATSAGWTALGPTVQGLLVHAEMAGEVPHDLILAIRDAFSGVQGEMETFVAMDPGGISIRTRSPVGNLLAVGTGFVVASIALPSVIANATEMEMVSSLVEPDAAMRDLVRQIAVAQKHRVKSSAKTTFVTLDELVEAGEIEADTLGEPLGNGVYQHGNFLLVMLLPTEANDRRSDFAVLAWPADEQRGAVLATTAGQPLLENRAIATSAGIRMVQPADLFLSGEFGTALVPGWREALEPVVAEQPTTAPRDQVLMAAILQAEQLKPDPVPEEVLEGLASENTRVAARAAWALGELGALEAVPKLCEVVENHPDAEVCRQVMSALVKLHDARSVVASTRALSSNDLTVRALAARNLGALRAQDATEALIGVVGRDQDATEGSTAGADRLAALLALTDLAVADALLPASAAVQDTDGELAQGIAFMFQTLSPRLDDTDEARALMAVLDHPSTALRRYAIQRLGELEDPTSLTALEGRLGGEDDRSLRPLVEVSLQAIRGTLPPTPEGEGSNPLTAAAAAWQRLNSKQRAMVAAGGTGTLVLVGALLYWRSRRRRAAQAEQWAAFTAPSEDFVDEGASEFDEFSLPPDEVQAYEEEYDEGYDEGDEIPGVFDEGAEGEFLDDVEMEFDEEEEMFVEGSGADFPAAERHGG